MTLSPTQTQILTAAAQHEQHFAKSPPGLPAGARNAVFRSMLRDDLLAEVAAPHEHVGLAWRQKEAGTSMVARITDAGLRAIGLSTTEVQEPAGGPCSATGLPREPEPTPITHAAPSAPRMPSATLRGAAIAVLAAWDDGEHGSADLAAAIERLRSLLTAKPAREPGSARTPRQGTKQAAVLALLRRPEGASGPHLQEATGWAPHTVRGFLAGLGRKGMAVTVLERVRQAGPGKTGAAGSYTVYRVLEAG